MSRVARACAASLMLIPAISVYGQSLHDRVLSQATGLVRMTYPARAGVCAGDTYDTYAGAGMTRFGLPLPAPDSMEWDNGCRNAQIHAVMQLRDRHVIGVRWYAGGAWGKQTAGTLDLGTVSAADASHLLIDLASESADNSRWSIISAATVADGGDLTRSLATIVNDRSRPSELRQWAVAALPFDRDTFVRIARNSDVPGVRRAAVQRLARVNDPDVVALLEEIVKHP